MTTPLDPPLVPRDGRTLNVLGICRISTVHQDRRSLADQEALLRRHVEQCYPGPVRWTILASQDSGQYLDRQELAQAEALIESRTLDLVIAEDQARICRRMKAYGICEAAQDCGTRLVAINDQVDTARPDWHLGALFGVYRHESYSRDTASRIRRSLRHRFTQGGVVQSVIYGYRKPPGAASDADIAEDDSAGPIYDEWFRKLEGGATYSEVADWLNGQGIRPGPACRAGEWNVPRVRGATLNPILKGVRVRNRKMSRRVNETGRPRSVDAPASELLERPAPHLAFIDPERYDRVVALLARRNAKYRRKGQGGRRPAEGRAEEADGISGAAPGLRRVRPPLLLRRARPGVAHDVQRREALSLLERGDGRRVAGGLQDRGRGAGGGGGAAGFRPGLPPHGPGGGGEDQFGGRNSGRRGPPPRGGPRPADRQADGRGGGGRR